ncbi:MAG TPA: helix-turn-helix transcriptional regulator [Chloroflexota bacterium]|jgi:predicted transcriptional regulator|nr:helix-turn-helix transcriptional regulator [Chloroflexota bacterium]
MSAFHKVLRECRERAGITAYRLARLGNVNSAYIYRMERPGGQVPRRDLLNSLISALQLEESESECLLVAAGYCPESIARLGTWDETLGIVANVLSDKALSDDDRDEFRQIVRAVASRWIS